MMSSSADNSSLLDSTNDFNVTVRESKLKNFNKGACVLHFVQGVMMLVASQAVDSIKNFTLDVTTSFLTYEVGPEGRGNLVTKTKTVGSVEIGVAAALFLLLSAVFHALVLFKWHTYISDLRMEINRFRWYEYALSSSIMICAIAMLFGCKDLGSLVLIFFVNAVMNLCGLLMEKLNPPGRQQVDWSPFIFGCIAGVAPWIVILMYFLGQGSDAIGKVPGFVYGILAGYFVFFNTFPVNMYLQYAKIGKWAEYRYGELCYIVLSLISKSLLAWLVFGGTFQPNGK